jgi:CheY-like chemotaxis protein
MQPRPRLVVVTDEWQSADVLRGALEPLFHVELVHSTARAREALTAQLCAGVLLDLAADGVSHEAMRAALQPCADQAGIPVLTCAVLNGTLSLPDGPRGDPGRLMPVTPDALAPYVQRGMLCLVPA